MATSSEEAPPLPQKSPRRTVAELRQQVLLGDLPEDFLRLAVAAPSAATVPGVAVVQQQYSFVPPNTRGRIAITVVDANLVKNYGLVRMDPYCRVRVGNAVFETPTKMNGGRTPFWNRIVHAYLPNGLEHIYIQIFDERAFSADECVAWAQVALPPAVFSGDTIDDYFQLSGQQGEGKEGVVHLIISFFPLDADPPLPPNVRRRPAQGGGGGQAQAAPAAAPITVSAEEIAELCAMFEQLDPEVVRAVLEEKRGDRNAAVNAMLDMTK